jgi:hypothetical protein
VRDDKVEARITAAGAVVVAATASGHAVAEIIADLAAVAQLERVVERRSRAARADPDENSFAGVHGDGVGVAERTAATAAGAKLPIERTTAPAGADNHGGHREYTRRYRP